MSAREFDYKQRPRQVSDEEWERRWRKTFDEAPCWAHDTKREEKDENVEE